MFKSTLIISTAFMLMPTTASAQGLDSPLNNSLNAHKVALNVHNVAQSTVRATASASRDVDESVILVAEAPTQMAAGENVEKAEKMVKKADLKKPSIHSDWTDILQSYVGASDSNGLAHFNYADLKVNIADKAKLDGYIESLEAMNPDSLSDNEAIAFWANLYNAVTIQVIVDNYPIKSIKKLGSFNSGPWKKDLVTVNGKKMSLNDIEHGTLRKNYPNPAYVHYMVNCASIGCPNLLNEAWEADTLIEQRKKSAADYINSPRGAMADGNDLTVSSIYDWFQEDFGGSKGGVIEHLSKYATGDLAAAIQNGAKIDDFEYDWSLNE